MNTKFVLELYPNFVTMDHVNHFIHAWNSLENNTLLHATESLNGTQITLMNSAI